MTQASEGEGGLFSSGAGFAAHERIEPQTADGAPSPKQRDVHPTPAAGGAYSDAFEKAAKQMASIQVGRRVGAPHPGHVGGRGAERGAVSRADRSGAHHLAPRQRRFSVDDAPERAGPVCFEASNGGSVPWIGAQAASFGFGCVLVRSLDPAAHSLRRPIAFDGACLSVRRDGLGRPRHEDGDSYGVVERGASKAYAGAAAVTTVVGRNTVGIV